MAPTDVVTLKTQPIVAAPGNCCRRGRLHRERAGDGLAERGEPPRQPEAPPQDGGWNLFFTNVIAADLMNPIANLQVNGKGRKGGWFGWPDDAKIEAHDAAFARSSSPGRNRKPSQPRSRSSFSTYQWRIYIPVGQYLRGGLMLRTSLSGVLLDGSATPVFLNVDKSGVRAFDLAFVLCGWCRRADLVARLKLGSAKWAEENCLIEIADPRLY